MMKMIMRSLMLWMLATGLAHGAQSYFGTQPAVATLHTSTNYVIVVLGDHQNSVIRKISPDNLFSNATAKGWFTIVGPQTNNDAIYIIRPTSTNVSYIQLGTTNGFFWRVQAPDAQTNNFIVVGPTNHPTANQVMAVESYSGSTIKLKWADAGGSSTGTNFASVGVTNFFRAFPQTNALSGLGSTNIVLDGGQGMLVRSTVTANFKILATNLIDGQEIRLEVKQDSTGIRTCAPTLDSNIRFGTDITSPLTFSTNANTFDEVKFVVRNTNLVCVGFVRGYTE